MVRKTSLVALALLLALVAAACSGDESDDTTTTTSAEELEELEDIDVTEAPDPEDGDAEEPGETTTTVDLSAAGIPDFEVVHEEATDDGNILVVVLDPESYTSLNDIDLQNVIAEIADQYSPVYEIHVVDSDDAAVVQGVLRAAGDRTDAQAQAVDRHYLVRLEESFRIVFEGTFSDIAPSILGS